ncbi:unnamed protein product [Closterium sp. Naga37s-1]|nr:unnamed protein product [Closterium sp. Naga37s-1]
MVTYGGVWQHVVSRGLRGHTACRLRFPQFPSPPICGPNLPAPHSPVAFQTLLEHVKGMYTDYEGIPPSLALLCTRTLLERVKGLYTDYEGIPPDRVVPTVGLNIGRVEAHKAKLIFWDLGGQIGLRTIWEKYYEEAHAVIYVVDAACPERFDDARGALEKVLRHEDLVGAPILIFANKQDLPEAVGEEDLTHCLELRDLKGRSAMVMPVCAYDGTGVREGVTWLVESMRKSQRADLIKQRADAAAAF